MKKHNIGKKRLFSEKCVRLLVRFSTAEAKIFEICYIFGKYKFGKVTSTELIAFLNDFFSLQKEEFLDPKLVKKLRQRDRPVPKKTLSEHLKETEGKTPFEIDFMCELDLMESLLIEMWKSMDDFKNARITAQELLVSLQQKLQASLASKLNEMDLLKEIQPIFYKYWMVHLPLYPLLMEEKNFEDEESSDFEDEESSDFEDEESSDFEDEENSDFEDEENSESTSPSHKGDNDELESHKGDNDELESHKGDNDELEFDFGSGLDWDSDPESELDGWDY